MVRRSRCLGPLLFAAGVLADYYVDNANTSVSYSMPPSQSGQSWQVFSAGTQSLALQIQNSTGNYTIELDASNCYDQNYALGVCGATDGCQVSIPFTGSGISMYVFNAGFSGIAASFSVDGARGYTNETAAPPPPNYQQSRMLIYDIQGLPSGNHTMVMTVVDWNGSPTSMKFDYAYVNETFVAKPAFTSSSTTSLASSTSTSQTPSQNSGSGSSKSVDLGAVIGGTLASVAFLIALVIGILYLRSKRKAPKAVHTPEVTYQATPFMSEYPSNGSPPFTSTAMPSFTGPSKTFFTAHPDSSSSVPPLMRSAILRDALAADTSSGPEPSITSGTTGSLVLQPLRRQPSLPSADMNAYRGSSAFSDSEMLASSTTHYNLTAEQIETIERLRADGVPQETISRVIEGFVTPRSSGMDSSSGIARGVSMLSAAPPPSYQTRIR